MEDRTSTREKVLELGGTFLPFIEADTSRVHAVDARQLTPERQAILRSKLAEDPTTENRYRLEYENRVYASYKPGIDDDGLESVVGFSLGSARVVEIGGGPSYIASRAGYGVCADIVRHPEIGDNNVYYIYADICHPGSVSLVVDKMPPMPRSLTVLSYCLDRVPNQVAALENFAKITQLLGGVGLITVCLPAKPSTMVQDSDSSHWVTKGAHPLEDYQCIAEVCVRAGLRFTKGGLTMHHGVSLDGHEVLPCYVLVFTP